jgi:hypothetical protein
MEDALALLRAMSLSKETFNDVRTDIQRRDGWANRILKHRVPDDRRRELVARKREPCIRQLTDQTEIRHPSW